MKQIYIDGYETASCSVNAIANCKGMTYAEAYQWLESMGRCKEYGIVFRDYISKLDLTPRTEFAHMTLAKVLPKLKGRFIVRTAGHVFAVIDCVIYDTFKQTGNTKVLMVYENKQDK